MKINILTELELAQIGSIYDHDDRVSPSDMARFFQNVRWARSAAEWMSKAHHKDNCTLVGSGDCSCGLYGLLRQLGTIHVRPALEGETT